jgi:predicted glycogen debranching enzyme
VENGIKMCMYEGYPELYMQTTAENEFHYQPDWYRGLDYPKERERGYESTEDLLVPGYFEMPIKKGESIIFTASLKEKSPKMYAKIMEDEIESLDRRDSFYHCLVNAAHQFHVQEGEEEYLLAGYPWFKARARDTFISLPGVTLAIGERDRFERYMKTAEKGLREFMNKQPLSVSIYEMEQPDTLLWATWCLQQYAKYTSRRECYEKYGNLLFEMINFVRNGKHNNLFVHENGLLYSCGRDRAVTWMNSTVNGHPIVPRSGYIVEFNALWYNALKFAEQMLSELGGAEHEAFAKLLGEEADKVGASFKEVFLNEHGYLLDYVDGQMMDWSVRPNQLFAIALDFSPLDVKERKRVLDICTKELVTPKGIRSLSPKSGGYNPMYIGQQTQRDYAYHQGTAWPWLTGFYLEAYLRVYKMSGVNYIERQLIGFEEELFYHCVGTIPELFDGNPRFSGRGAISFAMNVSGILRAIRLLEKYRMDED